MVKNITFVPLNTDRYDPRRAVDIAINPRARKVADGKYLPLNDGNESSENAIPRRDLTDCCCCCGVKERTNSISNSMIDHQDPIANFSVQQGRVLH